MLLALALLALSEVEGLLQDWPQFRGPDGQGHAEVARLPLKWTDASPNVAWKTPIPGLGWSSPVVAGERGWMTTATDEGKSQRGVAVTLEKDPFAQHGLFYFATQHRPAFAWLAPHLLPPL